MGILNLALLQIAPRDTVQGNLEKGVEYCRRARELGADIGMVELPPDPRVEFRKAFLLGEL